MPTPLNIKAPEAYQLASEIARNTGKSLTRVVVDALRHEQEALRRTSTEIDMGRVRAIIALFEDDRAAKTSVSTLQNDLYDERGLPR